MSAQISFSDPVGKAFHTAVLAGIEQSKKNGSKETYEMVATALIIKGMQLVRQRGLISDSDRRALKVENLIKDKSINASSTTIRYEPTEEFNSLREDTENETTLKGKKRVLKEAMFEYLDNQGLVSFPGI